MKTAIVVAVVVVVVLAVVALTFLRKSGYRGAVGFKNRHAREVSLTDVPTDAVDGELFFVLSSDGSWTVEYAPTLQLGKLQSGE
jgi:hypothetical protein